MLASYFLLMTSFENAVVYSVCALLKSTYNILRY